MSTVPFFKAGDYQIWIAGHPAYRNEARALFEKLADGLAERTGNARWAEIRNIVAGRHQGGSRA